jgi:hypothetical protein
MVEGPLLRVAPDTPCLSGKIPDPKPRQGSNKIPKKKGA